MTRTPNIYRQIGGTAWCSQYTAMDAAGQDRGRFLILSLFDRVRPMRGGGRMRARVICGLHSWDMRGLTRIADDHVVGGRS